MFDDLTMHTAGDMVDPMPLAQFNHICLVKVIDAIRQDCIATMVIMFGRFVSLELSNGEYSVIVCIRAHVVENGSRR